MSKETGTVIMPAPLQHFIKISVLTNDKKSTLRCYYCDDEAFYFFFSVSYMFGEVLMV